MGSLISCCYVVRKIIGSRTQSLEQSFSHGCCLFFFRADPSRCTFCTIFYSITLRPQNCVLLHTHIRVVLHTHIRVKVVASVSDDHRGLCSAEGDCAPVSNWLIETSLRIK